MQETTLSIHAGSLLGAFGKELRLMAQPARQEPPLAVRPTGEARQAAALVQIFTALKSPPQQGFTWGAQKIALDQLAYTDPAVFGLRLQNLEHGFSVPAGIAEALAGFFDLARPGIYAGHLASIFGTELDLTVSLLQVIHREKSLQSILEQLDMDAASPEFSEMRLSMVRLADAVVQLNGGAAFSDLAPDRREAIYDAAAILEHVSGFLKDFDANLRDVYNQGNNAQNIWNVFQQAIITKRIATPFSRNFKYDMPVALANQLGVLSDNFTAIIAGKPAARQFAQDLLDNECIGLQVLRESMEETRIPEMERALSYLKKNSSRASETRNYIQKGHILADELGHILSALERLAVSGIEALTQEQIGALAHAPQIIPSSINFMRGVEHYDQDERFFPFAHLLPAAARIAIVFNASISNEACNILMEHGLAFFPAGHPGDAVAETLKEALSFLTLGWPLFEVDRQERVTTAFTEQHMAFLAGHKHEAAFAPERLEKLGIPHGSEAPPAVSEAIISAFLPVLSALGRDLMRAAQKNNSGRSR